MLTRSHDSPRCGDIAFPDEWRSAEMFGALHSLTLNHSCASIGLESGNHADWGCAYLFLLLTLEQQLRDSVGQVYGMAIRQGALGCVLRMSPCSRRGAVLLQLAASRGLKQPV